MWVYWMKGKRKPETTSPDGRWKGRGWAKVWFFRLPAKGNVPRLADDLTAFSLQ